MSASQNPYHSHLNGTQGGGFLDSPGGETTPGGGKKFSGQQALRPVSMKHLSQEASQAHSDAEFQLDNIDLGPISFVCQLAQVKVQATNTVYSFRGDGVMLEGRTWKDAGVEIEEEEEMNLEDGLKDDEYVYVVGTWKNMNNKRHLNISSIRPVKSPFEIYHHILESVSATLYLTRGPPGQKDANGDVVMQGGGGSGAGAYQHTAISANSDEYSTVAPFDREVLNAIIKARGPTEGVHVAAIVRGLNNKATTPQISDALDRLMEDGHVYSTIDESHYDISA